MYVNKWAGFSVSVVCTISAGLAYCFSLYSNQLKDAFGYDQRQIQAVGSATNLGGYASIVSGLVYDSMLDWDGRGPRLTILIGVVINIIGWVSLWAAAKGLIPTPFWLILIIAGLTCNGGTWFDTACLVTSVRNFPRERGTVVGLLKACVGLSASVYTSMYMGFEEPDAIRYLLYLAFIPAFVGLFSSPFINYVPYTQKSELTTEPRLCTTGGRFLVAYQIIALLAVYLLVTAVVNQSGIVMLSHQTRLLLSLGTIALTLSILLVPLGSGGLVSQPAHSPSDDEEGGVKPTRSRVGGNPPGADPNLSFSTPRHAAEEEDAPLLSGTTTHVAEDQSETSRTSSDTREEPHGKKALKPNLPTQRAGGTADEGRPGTAPSRAAPTKGFVKQMPDMTLLQCCTSANFWLLFLTCSIGMGSGLAFLNNLGQLVTALGGAPNSQAVFVSLFSVSSCAGRLLLGILGIRIWGPGCKIAEQEMSQLVIPTYTVNHPFESHDNAYCGCEICTPPEIQDTEQELYLYIPERLLHARGTPRCIFLVIVSTFTAVVVCCNAFASLLLLFPASIMAGLAFGALWSLMATLTSEFFGLHHFASNYTFVQLAPATGGFMLGQLVGSLYEREASRQGSGKTCHGSDCFRLAFLLIALLDVVAVASSLILYLRTRHVYSTEYDELHRYDADMRDHGHTTFRSFDMGHAPSPSDVDLTAGH